MHYMKRKKVVLTWQVAKLSLPETFGTLILVLWYYEILKLLMAKQTGDSIYIQSPQ